MADQLPGAFADLERFVPVWAVSSMRERLALRVESSPENRLAFYQAMTPRAEAILDHLNMFDLDALPEGCERLLSLMLTLAEISMTEEVMGQSVEAIHAQSNRIMHVDRELDHR